MVFALATFSCTLPYFLFGDDLMISTNALYGGASINVNDASAISTSINSPNTSIYTDVPHISLCHSTNASGSLSSGMIHFLFTLLCAYLLKPCLMANEFVEH